MAQMRDDLQAPHHTGGLWQWVGGGEGEELSTEDVVSEVPRCSGQPTPLSPGQHHMGLVGFFKKLA